VGIHIMRRNVLEKSRGSPYPEQKRRIEQPSLGLTCTPFRIRALADAIWILTTNDCPDRGEPGMWTYARCSDTVPYSGALYQVVVGFAPGAGLHVTHSFGFSSSSLVVVPGGPADVPGPLALGDLESEFEHLALADGRGFRR